MATQILLDSKPKQIYKITNRINGKIYIGKTSVGVETRWIAHKFKSSKKVNRYLYDAMNHYGPENFTIEEIETCGTETELRVRERYWIRFYGSMNKENGYNLQEGGIGGAQPIELRKLIGQKVALKLKGRPRPNWLIERLLEGRRNTPVTEKTKDMISNTLKNKYATGELKSTLKHFSGVHHPMYGKHHNANSRKLISAARMGKKYDELFSKEVSEKLRRMHKASFVGNKNPNYVEINMMKLKEMVDNRVFIKDIAFHFNVSPPTIMSKFRTEFGMNVREYRGFVRIPRGPYKKKVI